jgi:cation transport ATPase
VSFALGFLILAEGIAGFVPTRWLILFLVSSLGTFVLLIASMLSGRRALGLRGWRSTADARFFWLTVLSIVAAVLLGLATALTDGDPAFFFSASVLAVYVTLARWTWWTWRASR